MRKNQNKRERSKAAVLVDVDSVGIWVYPTPSRGRPGWTACYRFDGRRQRKWFADRELALAHADDKARKISSGRTAELLLTAADAASFLRAQEIIRWTGVPLEVVAAEWSESRKTDLRRMVNGGAKPVSEVASEYLDQATAMAKERGRSTSLRHVAGLRRLLTQFADAFRVPVGRLRGPAIQEWLLGLRAEEGEVLSARTRHNYLAAVRALVKFGVERGYLTDGKLMAGVRLPRPGPGEIVLYSPEELAKVLRYAATKAPRFVPFLAIQAFTGIRTEEMTRLRGEHLHVKTGWIALGPEITKTRRRRLIPLHRTLRRWLKAFPAPDGPIAPATAATVTARLCEVISAAGVATRHNGLRNSYASYRMAVVRDSARVADELGNSPAMMAQSYREVRLPDGRIVTEAIAQRWFAVTPTGATNITRMPRPRRRRAA